MERCCGIVSGRLHINHTMFGSIRPNTYTGKSNMSYDYEHQQRFNLKPIAQTIELSISANHWYFNNKLCKVYGTHFFFLFFLVIQFSHSLNWELCATSNDEFKSIILNWWIALCNRYDLQISGTTDLEWIDFVVIVS